MIELFNDISQSQKEIIIFNLLHMPGDSFTLVKNINDYVSSLSQREQDFANFYLQTIFERAKGEQNENNSN